MSGFGYTVYVTFYLRRNVKLSRRKGERHPSVKLISERDKQVKDKASFFHLETVYLSVRLVCKFLRTLRTSDISIQSNSHLKFLPSLRICRISLSF